MAKNMAASQTKIEIPLRARIGTAVQPASMLPPDLVVSLSNPAAGALTYDAPTGWAQILRVSNAAQAFQLVATSPSLGASVTVDITIAAIATPTADNIWWDEAAAQIT